MRRFSRLVAFVTLIVLSCAALAFASSVEDNRIWAVAPARVRVIPEAEAWRIPVAVLALEQLPAGPVVESISCLGKDLSGTIEDQPVRIPVIVCRGMAASAVDRWVELRRIREEGELTEDQALELERLTGLISQQADNRDGPPAVIRIGTDRLPFTVQDQQDYPVVVRLRAGGQPVEFVTIMAVRTLPPDPEWSPADLHLHTSYSPDGNGSPSDIASQLKDEGYRIAYVTDHTDGIASHGWSVYASAVIASSIPNEISLYPGAEMTVGDWDPETGLWVIQGDLLAHGVNSLTGLENMEWSAQQGIDNIWANSSYSSAAIAHPSGSPPWTEWTVTNYRGFELMSGLQGVFHDGATPMVKWRSELTRLLENTFRYGYFASARTGSDWHQGRLEPSHRQYVTWVRTPNWSSRSDVDIALLLGRTVASQKGGLAYMTISYGSTTKRVGDILTGVPAGATLVLKITFKPVESGTYTIKVYRNDKVQEVFSKTDYYGGGQTYDLTWPDGDSFTFPGGSNYYYLYVAGSDFICSSPIFMKGNWLPTTACMAVVEGQAAAAIQAG